MNFYGIRVTCFLLGAVVMSDAEELLAQQNANYDEEKVPKYTLPDPLICEDGTKVTTVEQWQGKRRAELVKLFEKHVYGRVPEFQYSVDAKEITRNKEALGNGSVDVIQRQLTFNANEKSLSVNVAIFLPSGADGPVPVYLGYNFYGNQTVTDYPGILLPTSWARNSNEFGIVDNRATEKSRGVRRSRWPIELITSRGYGVATVYYGDVDPDFDDDFQNGVHPLANSGDQTKPAPDQWGSIAAWAWCLSRVLDDFANVEAIDQEKVIVIGHSRLGKTALWAGASDPRFAIVVSNNSGCGGAALSRRAFGETVERINVRFPHWFCDNFNKYNENEAALPIDQHELIALMAPRPVYVCSASEDRWADPYGEFLSCVHAAPVYEIFGKKGLGTEEMPSLNQSIGNSIGYHIRKGKHDINEFDWTQHLNFADQQFKK